MDIDERPTMEQDGKNLDSNKQGSELQRRFCYDVCCACWKLDDIVTECHDNGLPSGEPRNLIAAYYNNV